MAFEATHVLFACDLASTFPFESLSDLIEGAVYPDSRYVTGLERKVTHGASAPQSPFATSISDFDRGWATHVLYDELAGARMRALVASDPRMTTPARYWLRSTAMKLIEDQASYSKLAVTGRVGSLRTWIARSGPNGESEESMTRYLAALSRLYRRRPTLRDYSECLVRWGIESADAAILSEDVVDIEADVDLRQAILDIYPAMFAAALSRANAATGARIAA